ncbi:MAG: DUF445 domain-containing protein [Acidimicrobiales bacterium]
MKRVATGMLILAAIVFVVARWQEEHHHWVGYIRATAEAAMVGALADWFAVTALFRHPLGIPIPHTAIIEKRKDEIGASMGTFVRDNFLTKEIVTERLASAELGRRVGEWLAQPDNARKVGDQSAVAVKGVTEVLRDETVQGGLEHLMADRVRAIPVAPLVGKAIDVAVEGAHHQIVLDATLTGLGRFLQDNQSTFRQRLGDESPWWVPDTVDDVVFAKIYEVSGRWLDEIGRDRNHEFRRQLDARTAELAERLRNDPALLARGEELKEELLAHPEVRAWTASLWTRIKAGLIEATEDADSSLRRQLDAALADAGQAICDDPALQAHIDDWVLGATGYVAEQFRDEVADLIATTVQRWDAEETSDRMEEQVGRDLQFIRINGTLVGGLAGLTIYTVSELLF